jgi:hypothetical protein
MDQLTVFLQGETVGFCLNAPAGPKSRKRDDIQTIGDLGKRGMGTAIPRFEVQDLYSELAQIGKANAEKVAMLN